MATPSKHALLSASAAHRWLNCTAAPRFEAMFSAETSEYAQEGTLAHSFCELYARRKFTTLSTRKFNSEIKKLQENPLYQEEMLTTAETYVQYLTEKAAAFPSTPHVSMEVKVDLSDIIPGGFGTCDNAMIGGDTLHITDYKHGKGVIVSAKDNPQTRLYAFGALKLYAPIFGDYIKKVSMGICQPRVTEDVSEECMTVAELFAWAEEVKVIAKCAYDGPGEFKPGDYCRFCRGRSVCRARAMKNLAMEEFKDCVPEGKSEPPADKMAREILGLPPVLSDSETGDILVRGAGLVRWYEDLQNYALQAILGGKAIPGFKVVEGKSNRAFVDTDAALKALLDSGIEKAIIYDYKAKSLSELEKVIGKKRFAELVGDQITKPRGKPTLAEESDKRNAYSLAAADFADVAQPVE